MVPFNKVYAVAGGIRKIRDVAAAKRLRLVSSDLAIEAATCGECSLKHFVKIVDYEIEVDWRPVAAVDRRSVRPRTFCSRRSSAMR